MSLADIKKTRFGKQCAFHDQRSLISTFHLVDSSSNGSGPSDWSKTLLVETFDIDPYTEKACWVGDSQKVRFIVCSHCFDCYCSSSLLHCIKQCFCKTRVRESLLLFIMGFLLVLWCSKSCATFHKMVRCLTYNMLRIQWCYIFADSYLPKGLC